MAYPEHKHPTRINPARLRQLRRALLQVLRHADGYAVPAETLRNHIHDLLSPPMDLGEWGCLVKWGLDNKYITEVEDPLDPELRQYALTAHGRTALLTL